MSVSLPGWEGLSSTVSVIVILFLQSFLAFVPGSQLSDDAIVCDPMTLTSRTGSLRSNNLTEVYNNEMNCRNVIHINGASVIEISFQSFFTESISDLNLINEMCTHDYVELVSSGKAWKICGDWTGKEHLLYFTFHFPEVFIKFYTNEQVTKPGFVLNWTATVIDKSLDRNVCTNALYETESSCYELIENPEDWSGGYNTCQRRGAALASVHNPDTHRKLQETILERYVLFYVHCQRYNKTSLKDHLG